MSKAVDPWRAIGPTQDLGDAVAVVRAFVRIRQGNTLEAIRIGQDLGDGAAGELLVVERENDVGQQDASELALDDAFGSEHRHARTLGDVFGLLLDVGGTHSHCLMHQPVGSFAFRLSNLAFSTIESDGQAAIVSSCLHRTQRGAGCPGPAGAAAPE